MIDPTEIRRFEAPAAPLTREAMRADIAAMLHEAPEAIDGGDSLMDLGLDSMRAMNLVLGWSKGGLNLEFSEFAEHPTLDGWWAIVSRRMAEQAGQPAAGRADG
ncbi:phosphopantetheine-binding protein [Ancylobacter sp. 6x-1]|uniref:Phosphopantetheine-binding protein n=1 Tax=Ancylobacter crimeensis TaxID=2579147 RepID=A0ABT0DB91_9HYPH|nr:phosphopantetheine-binding protein [Ancylobacter crimeensis]MCK0197231.1 phosphopantetheine-binding protein [Ancylobacter crimeensis]